MSTTEPAGHLAIGEVLTLLREDFPDITISKIRFLESQGLIQPERTPSGYRKFFDADIERLRWVLRQQKERFLPLKVIKERLDSGDALTDPEEQPAQASLFASEGGPAPAASPTGPPAAAEPTVPGPSPSLPLSPAAESPATAPASATGETSNDPAAWLAALQEAPKRRPTLPVPPRPVEPPIVLDDAAEVTHYSAEELAEAAGLTGEQLGQLVEFGIVRAAVIGGVQTFDDSALGAARAAAAFVSRGIEARHLRAYKLAAEREVGLFEQLILPLLRQRNPAARAQAAETLAELGEAGAEMRRALLRQALRASLPPS